MAQTLAAVPAVPSAWVSDEVLGQLAQQAVHAPADGSVGIDLKTVALGKVAEGVAKVMPEKVKAAAGAAGTLGAMGGMGQLGGGTKL